MNNLEKMQGLLAKLKVPRKQQTELCAYTLLAMAGIKKKTSWNKASNEWVRIHDIIQFTEKITARPMQRTVVKHSVNKPFIIFVQRHSLKIMGRLPIVPITVIA